MIAQLVALSKRLHAVQVDRRIEERHERTDGVAAAAYARADRVRLKTGHLLKLVAHLLTDDHLEIADHQRERMRAEHAADAVDGVLILASVRVKRGVNRFLERLEAMGNRNDLRAENLHAGDVGRLLGDVNLAHVDLAFQTEECRRRRQRNAVLACAGFRDELLLAHVLGEQALAHTVVELVRAGMVEVLALEVDLRAADLAGQALAVVDRSRSALEIAADAAKLVDELRTVADGLIRLGDLGESRLQLVGNHSAAVFAKVTLFIGMITQIGTVIHNTRPPVQSL